MSKHIQFRSPECAAALLKRGSANETAKRDLERYYILLQYERSKLNLSENESMFFVEMLNGSRSDFNINPANYLLASAMSALEDDRLHEKWGLEKDPLFEKLVHFSVFQAAAIIDAAEMFWTHESYEIKDNLKKLKEIGLL